jgi:hypothetical protein
VGVKNVREEGLRLTASKNKNIYLFNDGVSVSQTTLRQMKLQVNDELERMWKEAVVV